MIFTGLGEQRQQHDPEHQKPVVVIMDGQHGLWDDAAAVVPESQRVDILDLLHATSKLWDAVHLFHPSGSESARKSMKVYTLPSPPALSKGLAVMSLKTAWSVPVCAGPSQVDTLCLNSDVLRSMANGMNLLHFASNAKTIACIRRLSGLITLNGLSISPLDPVARRTGYTPKH